MTTCWWPIVWGGVVLQDEDEEEGKEVKGKPVIEYKSKDFWDRFREYLNRDTGFHTKQFYLDLKDTELIFELILQLYIVIYVSERGSATFWIAIVMIVLNSISFIIVEITSLKKFPTYTGSCIKYCFGAFLFMQTVCFITMIVGIINAIGGYIFLFVPLQIVNVFTNVLVLFMTDRDTDNYKNQAQGHETNNRVRFGLIANSFVSFISKPIQLFWLQKTQYTFISRAGNCHF